jgi:hypothetical protein
VEELKEELDETKDNLTNIKDTFNSVIAMEQIEQMSYDTLKTRNFY